mmetsp:Transcript_25242/g.58103  ORF Transcript_25242/g.58103 Transcript_25242/m.58103 type:complete len:469 (-) Transcript_25242:35-1441(-)
MRLDNAEPAKPKAGDDGADASTSTECSRAQAEDGLRFVISLDASCGAPPLGLVLATGTSSLLVKNISEFPNALARTWNVENPEKAVLPGDVIVSVNGVRGSGDTLVKQIRAGGILELQMLRRPSIAMMSPTNSEAEDCVDPQEIPEHLVGSLYGLRSRNELRCPTTSLEEAYEVGETIGEGGYGCVQKAVLRRTGETYAVKSISFEKLKVGRDYEQELVVLKRLSHPNVVHLLEVYQDSQYMHFVMEYCSGGSLDDKLRSVDTFTKQRQGRAGLVDQQLEQAALQILISIAYLHHHCFVHRDIKPDNYLLVSSTNKDSFTLKLVDFGLACRMLPGQVLTEMVGTSYYVAPEVLDGEYTEKCDIWSAGVTLFQLTIGALPCPGRDRQEVFQKVKAGNLEWNDFAWRNVKKPFRELVQGLLTHEASSRPSAKELFRNDPFLAHACKEVSSPKKRWMPSMLKGMWAKSRSH